MVKSICPYCAVGCGQRVYVKDGEVTQIEGDPDSPISRGRVCPRGSSSTSLVYERDGTVQALVNVHSFTMQGREPIRCAIIDV